MDQESDDDDARLPCTSEASASAIILVREKVPTTPYASFVAATSESSEPAATSESSERPPLSRPTGCCGARADGFVVLVAVTWLWYLLLATIAAIALQGELTESLGTIPFCLTPLW